VNAPPQRLVLPSSLDALGEAREWIAEHARAAGFCGRDVLDLELVVTEAVSNVVQHAYGGEQGREVELHAHTQGRDLVLRIIDQGEPLTEPGPARTDGTGGYGLGLIDALVDSVHRSTGEGDNLLELVKHRPERPS
jgi:serine/threonine-protein kinase RsbW